MILNPLEEIPRSIRPSWRKLPVHGKSIWLEANSLVLWEGDETPPRSALGRIQSTQPPRRKAVQNPSVVVLIPTFGCNLLCKYCYGKYGKESARMTVAIARRAINLLKGKHLRFSFFGGEPLLAFDLIRDTTHYAEGKATAIGGRVAPSITTNGLLIDESVATWCGKHSVSFIVSIDGPQELHDKYRPDTDGKGTWKRVLHGAELLAAAKVRALALRSTFTPDDVQLLERVKFLNNLVRRGVGNSVSVEPSCLAEHECGRGTRGFKAHDIRALSEEYHRLAEWMLAEWRAGRAPRHMQLERMMRRLLDRRPQWSTCGAGNGYWTVGPSGEIYACHHASPWSVIGSLDGGPDKRRAPWVDNRLVQSTECSACPWRFVCGGACRDDGMRCNGKLWTPSKTHCAIKFLWIKEVVWMISEARREGFLDRLRETADRPANTTKSCCGNKGGAEDK